MTAAIPLLRVEELTTEFRIRGGRVVRAVDAVSFDVAAGTTLGVVGESGSGKSVLIRSILRIVDQPGRITGGRVLFQGENLLDRGEAEMRAIRGSRIAMIFQNPAGSLNPVATVGSQFVEVIRAHERIRRRAALDRARRLLSAVGVRAPDELMARRPYELSGGLIQRIMIALALVCGPALILADEPTTSLDVTVQEQIIEALRAIQRDFGTAIIFISHDMGVVSEISDRIMVMYGGRAVEQGDFRDILTAPLHPYTRGLIRSVPSADLQPGQRLLAIPGQPPDLSQLEPGCRYRPRCERAEEVCVRQDPPLRMLGPGRLAACHCPIGVHADALA
jgi:oligopeptide/dipeptide ABC transporter ATP-binding protein